MSQSWFGRVRPLRTSKNNIQSVGGTIAARSEVESLESRQYLSAVAD